MGCWFTSCSLLLVPSNPGKIALTLLSLVVRLSCMCDPIHTCINFHTYIYIHIHTLYIDTVMDPYTLVHTMVNFDFQLSDNFQLRFSWNNDLCLSFSGWRDLTAPWHHEWRSTSTTVSWYISTHLHIYIHSNSPFRVRIRIRNGNLSPN
jgi:hypothetical protein